MKLQWICYVACNKHLEDFCVCICLFLFAIRCNFFLQVVHHKGKKLWILFNRWGRIGDTGQHQQTPFNTVEEACKEFKKIFKSKTGNNWDERPL